MVSTVLATGYVYKFLGWGLLVIAITFLFGRVFCNWMCPFGTLHQFVGWLFNVKSNSGRIEQNRYVDAQYLKYAVLIVFLIMSSMGALQIGLLDPIVIMYRALTTVIAPASDMAVDQIVGVAADAGVTVSFVDQLCSLPLWLSICGSQGFSADFCVRLALCLAASLDSACFESIVSSNAVPTAIFA